MKVTSLDPVENNVTEEKSPSREQENARKF